MDEAINQIVSFFRHAAQGLEERKQILYLLGPVGGGKSSLAERLKQLMERQPIYALKGSPVNESPLGLFPVEQYGQTLEQEYGIPRRYLAGIMSPWAVKRVHEYGGDISKFRVVRLCPSVLRQVAIAKTEPEMVAALGRALPEYRWRLAWTAITGAASTSAAIALAPLPILDVIPLLAVQTAMVLGIARIYQYDITLKRARELTVTFGLGFLGRTLFQELSKLGGPPGWLLAAAIASSTTVVMGYASIVWFERGERLTNDTLKEITKNVTKYLLDSLRGLGGGKPSKQGLQQRMAEVLEESPLAKDRGAMDGEIASGH